MQGLILEHWLTTLFTEKLRYLVFLLLIVVAMGFLFQRMPTAYLPDEDQGVLYVQAMLPANSTLEQTQKVLDRVQDHFLVDEKDAVESIMTIAGSELFRQRDRTWVWHLSSSRTGSFATGRI